MYICAYKYIIHVGKESYFYKFLNEYSDFFHDFCCAIRQHNCFIYVCAYVYEKNQYICKSKAMLKHK